MKRVVLLGLIIGAALIISALPALAGSAVISGYLGSSNVLPNGRPADYGISCVSSLDSSGTYYYTLRQIQVTVTGSYHYYDIGYEDSDTNTNDSYVSFYTGAPSTFDPANPLGNGCFANVDDDEMIPLTAGVTYTLMITTYDGVFSEPGSTNTGNYVFSLDGPGDVLLMGGDCPNPLPTSAVVHSLPAGAPAFWAPDLSAGTGFNIPAGTWWTTGTSGDFTHLWIACQANPVWVPSNAVSP